MAAHAPVRADRMNVDEFIAWAADRPGRYELENGRAVAMAPERTRHAETKFRVQSSLDHAIRAAGLPCRMLPNGMTVRIAADRAFEPDALVYGGPCLPGDAVEVPAPLIVVEVLSPGTAGRDVSAKLAGYFTVPSIAHYVIVDPDSRVIVHHARGEGDLIATRIASTGALHLAPPGFDIDVADLFGEPED